MHCSFGLKFGEPKPTGEPLFVQILPNILQMIYAIDSTKQHPFLIRPLSLKNRNVPRALSLLPRFCYVVVRCSHVPQTSTWAQLTSNHLATSFDPFTKAGMKISHPINGSLSLVVFYCPNCLSEVWNIQRVVLGLV